jgi:hypothetical protein
MLQVLHAPKAKLRVFYALHHRYRPGDCAELGNGVTVVNDATADYSDEEIHVALDINMPN